MLAKEYWFLMHWLAEVGPVHERALERRDEQILQVLRRYDKANYADGWWELSEIGHRYLREIT